MRRGSGAPGGRGARLLLLVAALLFGAAAGHAQQPGPPRVLERAPVRVVYWPGGRPRAEEVLAAALRPPFLPGFPGRRAPVPSTIVLAPSPAVFDSVTGGRAPEWGAGVAIPSTGTIVLPVYSSPRTRPEQLPVTLRHELVHLALHQELPGRIPRWFNEGYAEWVSGGWSPDEAWRLRVAFLMGKTPPLDSLSLDWPWEENDARLAYLLSATAVQHLAERSGPGGFETLIRAWKREGSLDRALRAAYGMTPGQFEEEWRKLVERRYGWLMVLFQATVFWLLASLLVVGLFLVRRRRDRAKLAVLRQEERMLPPPPPPGLDVDYPLE